jgi:hypothetical protein
MAWNRGHVPLLYYFKLIFNISFQLDQYENSDSFVFMPRFHQLEISSRTEYSVRAPLKH